MKLELMEIEITEIDRDGLTGIHKYKCVINDRFTIQYQSNGTTHPHLSEEEFIEFAKEIY